MPVQGIQGHNQVLGGGEFAVVVVLDDETIGALRCPVQKVIPPPQGHDGPGREVVGGGDVDRGGVGLPQGPYAEAFAVDRDELGGQAASVADVGKFFVSGVLKSKDRGGTQDLDQSLIQEFRSGANDDLGRGDLHPPVPPQIVGNGLTQRQQPVIGDVRKKFPVGV